MHLDLYRSRSFVVLLIVIISFLFLFGQNCMRGNEKNVYQEEGRSWEKGV